MFGITVLLKDQVLFFFSFFLKMLSLDGKIGGNLSIGTATLNSIGLKEKANLMPREEKISEFVPTLLVPFPPAPPPQKKKEVLYTGFAYFTDIWWFYSSKQLVKLSKWTQFCLPFCKFLIFAV